jgi:hypothetical protein
LLGVAHTMAQLSFSGAGEPRYARRYGYSQSSAAVLRSYATSHLLPSGGLTQLVGSIMSLVVIHGLRCYARVIWFVSFRRQCPDLSRRDQVSEGRSVSGSTPSSSPGRGALLLAVTSVSFRWLVRRMTANGCLPLRQPSCFPGASRCFARGPSGAAASAIPVQASWQCRSPGLMPGLGMPTRPRTM